MGVTSKRRRGELTRALFEVLLKHPDGMRAKDALEALSRSLTLTEYEQGFYSPGVQRFANLVRFNTIAAVKAGWMAKTKGSWALTDQGRAAFERYRDPEAFRDEMMRLYARWKDTQPEENPGDDDELAAGASNEGRVSVTFEMAEEQAWSEIERHLRTMPPYEFQELVASLLRAMGYHVSWIAPPGKDGGIDILAFRDPLGTQPPRIKVQVKRHASAAVAVDGLRSFMALLADDDVGLFVCTAGFTKDARDEARTQEKRKVTLVDLERLFDLWVEHYAKLDEKAQRRFPLEPIYFLAPREA